MSDPLPRNAKEEERGAEDPPEEDPTNDSQMRTSRRSEARRPRHLFVLSAGDFVISENATTRNVVAILTMQMIRNAGWITIAACLSQL